MFTKIKSFFKTTAIYGIVGSTRSFSEFLLLPLYARFLSPEDFGLLDILMIYVMIGMVLAVLEMNNAAFRFYFDRDGIEYQREVISSSFLATSLNGLIVFIVSMVFGERLSLWLFNSTSHTYLFYIAGLIVFLNSICTVPFNVLRIKNLAVKYTVLSLVLVSLSIAGTVVFLSVFHLGAMGILLAKALSFVPIVIISIFNTRRYLRIKINLKLIKGMLKYSLPLIPTGMAIWGINGINRIFMTHYLPLDQIGYFSLASKFVVILTLTVIAFQLAWPQFAFSNMNSKSSSKTFAQVFEISATFGIWLVVFITMFSGDFINIAMTREYSPASSAVMPLAMGMLFYGIFYFFTTGAIIEKKTTSILFPLISAIIFNITFNMIITPVYGFKGTAWVTLSSYFIMAVAMFLKVRHSDYIELDYVKLIKLVLVSSVYIPAALLLSYEYSLTFIAVKTIVLASFFPLLGVMGIIDRSYWYVLVNMVRRKSNGRILMVKKHDQSHETSTSANVPENSNREKVVSVLGERNEIHN